MGKHTCLRGQMRARWIALNGVPPISGRATGHPDEPPLVLFTWFLPGDVKVRGGALQLSAAAELHRDLGEILADLRRRLKEAPVRRRRKKRQPGKARPGRRPRGLDAGSEPGDNVLSELLASIADRSPR